ncbi:uncharacterized protein LOC129268249 [Lytechinus pictus]|uniref:uncharacterized protein LOC129268249 n=1 Tax=Lytechinus pictus TaxID=7653 RepID=UPI0030BA1033
MGKLTCECLNINIHTKGDDLRPLDPTLLGLSIDQLRAPFFERDIAEVQLDLGGVTEEQKYLVHKTTVADWCIRTCVNCKIPAYATHATKGLERVLVNTRLVSDETRQDSIQSSAAFSTLYKVVLADSGEKSNSSSLVHPMTGNQEVIRKTVAQLQDHLNKYISREKLAMEERIRRYSEEQKAAFSQLQKRAYQDKNVMVGVILNAEERNLEDSLSDAMLDNTLTPPTTPISRPGTVQTRSSDKLASSVPASRAPMGKFTPSMAKSRPIPQQARRVPHSSIARSVPAHTTHREVTRTSSDADTMFDLEGFTQDEEPFFESDESSTDDNSLNDENVGAPVTRVHHEYATSVPISMPMWKKEKHSFEEEAEEKVPMPEPDHMVASMRALSFSVNDGTEMFGDLPRPRLNTAGEVPIKKGARRL